MMPKDHTRRDLLRWTLQTGALALVGSGASCGAGLRREPNEAYLTRVPGEQYAVYFTDGGGVRLDLSGEKGDFDLRWLEAATGQWRHADPVSAGAPVALQAPGPGIWVALLSR